MAFAVGVVALPGVPHGSKCTTVGWEKHLCQRIVREVVSTMDDGVDVTADRAVCLRSLGMLKGMVEVLFHGGTSGLDNGLGTQLQPVVNVTDIICSNAMFVGSLLEGLDLEDE